MKILVITTFYPEPGRSDLIQDTSVVHYFAKEWVEKGHDVTVLHLYAHNFKNILKYKPNKYGKFQEMRKIDGVKVYLMENQFFIRNSKHYLKKQQHTIAARINTLLEDENIKPDVLAVHFPSHFYGVIEKLNINCPKKAIFHITDVRTCLNDSKVLNSIQKTYHSFAARSKKIMNDMTKMGIKVNFIANSGIDGNKINKNRKINKQINKKMRVLYVGSFIKRKNIETIIKTLGELNQKMDFTFTIIGDGKRRKKLETLTKKENIYDKCFFVGRKSREEVLKYMENSDVFITVSKNETLGLTYMEAMSQGCLTIGSINEGIDGIIKNNKNGFLVEAGNSNQLTETLLKIHNMESDDQQLIINKAIETIQELSTEKVSKEYFEFLNN